MFAYWGVAPGPWAAAPCSAGPAGGLGRQCQVDLASCPASGVVSSSFPPAPSESCRFSLPAGGNTPPRKGASRHREEITAYVNSAEKITFISLFLKTTQRPRLCIFLPECWPTRTCPLQPFERKPQDFPSADLLAQWDQELGKWPARCSHTSQKESATVKPRTYEPASYHPICFISLAPICCENFLGLLAGEQTHSLWTRWLRRSCVMSSCQDFLMPAAEGGVAVGMEARFPTPSFIKLGGITTKIRVRAL